MKILLVNNMHSESGGTETYYFNISKLLKSHNHQIGFFSTFDKKNKKTKDYIKTVKYPELNNINSKNWLNIFLNSLYSVRNKFEFSNTLDEFKPDIIHFQNIYMAISPSILHEAKKRNIPSVMTVHDYNLITPNNIFFHNGAVCWVPLQKGYLHIIFHKCVRGSFFGTFLITTILKIHRVSKIYQKNIDFFIFPSTFSKHLFEKSGLKTLDNLVLNNFAFKTKYKKGNPGKYVLYFGQIAEHKGVESILEAAFRLPQINFVVVGEGPLTEKIKDAVKRMHLINVKAFKFRTKKDLAKIIRMSMFTVVPSIWPENQPYSIIESFSFGKPVVASNIGGINEIVNNTNGILVTPNNIEELTHAIQRLWLDKNLRGQLGEKAKKDFLLKYSDTLHYTRLMSVYKKLINEKK